jgi:hypothetical protein
MLGIEQTRRVKNDRIREGCPKKAVIQSEDYIKVIGEWHSELMWHMLGYFYQGGVEAQFASSVTEQAEQPQQAPSGKRGARLPRV